MIQWRSILIAISFLPVVACRTTGNNAATLTREEEGGYRLVWADEFNNNGAPDSSRWKYEHGFVRNFELQWYQPENAFCEKGNLVIEARREDKVNPVYEAGSKHWQKSRQRIQYTSSCVITAGKASWQYGRFEMRGRIDVSQGIWPAWWTLGVRKPWPANGEIDIMEFYKGRLLANIACQGTNSGAEWYSNTFPVDSLGGKAWAEKFHVWRMDWTKDYIALYVDDQLLNKVASEKLVNKNGSKFNPFQQPHYMLLDLAIGGINGGDPSATTFPKRFEIDYVRVYQKE
jgi:beta-glucanase (GH16 family)